MATINVYVPDALKAQMDQLEGRNWSAVAQEAFRKTIEAEKAKPRWGVWQALAEYRAAAPPQR